MGSEQLSEGRKAEISVDPGSSNEGPTLRRQSQWPEGHTCERDAGTTTSGKCLRGCKILPRKIRGKSRGSIFLENCGVPECEKGERARSVAHSSFLTAVVQAGAEGAPAMAACSLSFPIKTTLGVLLDGRQKVKGTRVRRHRVHTSEEIS